MTCQERLAWTTITMTGGCFTQSSLQGWNSDSCWADITNPWYVLLIATACIYCIVRSGWLKAFPRLLKK
jgi:hypothetical protein